MKNLEIKVAFLLGKSVLCLSVCLRSCTFTCTCNLKPHCRSVGVLAYVLLTGYSPFAGDTKQETFMNISQVNLEFPEDLFEDISLDAQDFISKLLVKDTQ